MSSRYLRICAVATYGLLASCSAGEGQEDLPIPELGMLQNQSHPVLAPQGDDVLQNLVEVWARRWTRATGIEIKIADYGAPVRYDTDMHVEGLKDTHPDACGETIESHNNLADWTNEVRIDPSPIAGCPDLVFTVGHEMAHVLSGTYGQHSESGLFSQPQDNAPWPRAEIDSVSLATVCSYATCTAFKPEYTVAP